MNFSDSTVAMSLFNAAGAIGKPASLAELHSRMVQMWSVWISDAQSKRALAELVSRGRLVEVSTGQYTQASSLRCFIAKRDRSDMTETTGGWDGWLAKTPTGYVELSSLLQEKP